MSLLKIFNNDFIFFILCYQFIYFVILETKEILGGKKVVKHAKNKNPFSFKSIETKHQPRLQTKRRAPQNPLFSLDHIPVTPCSEEYANVPQTQLNNKVPQPVSWKWQLSAQTESQMCVLL